MYKTKGEKFTAVVEEIIERHAKGQPILVGTISIETSEMLSRKLDKHGIRHNVLNAKQHEREAEIVAQAGRKGAVTISTNMAGRGTDIVLGGNPGVPGAREVRRQQASTPTIRRRSRISTRSACAERDEVVAGGGLHIIGTERHESRRVDNQLRGRAGRQGDPGSTQFFLSLEDDLLRIFESERVAQWWDRVGVEEGEAIENRLLTRVIENAQKKVEARNFDIRKHLLDYDDVMNRQRRAFYERRRDALAREDVHAEILDMVEGAIVGTARRRTGPRRATRTPRRSRALAAAIEAQFGVVLDAEVLPRSPEAVHRAGPRRRRPRGVRRRGRGARGQAQAVRRARRGVRGERLPASSRASSATSCCASSTCSGRITCTRWTACARASGCAATRRAIRSSSTSARATRCSRR